LCFTQLPSANWKKLVQALTLVSIMAESKARSFGMAGVEGRGWRVGRAAPRQMPPSQNGNSHSHSDNARNPQLPFPAFHHHFAASSDLVFTFWVLL
jgi:hypothetical protein